jgi:HEAT repeat protein
MIPTVKTTLCFLVLSCLIGRTAAVAGEEEDWERSLHHRQQLRVSQMVRGLDSPVDVRMQYVEALVEEAAGDGREMTIELLAAAIQSRNPQIREGTVDVLARLGSADTIPILVEQLQHDGFPDLRLRIMRALTTFLAASYGKLHREVIDMAERETYGMTDRLCRVLRQPPMRDSNNAFDPVRDQIRTSVTAGLASQLDPIGTAIENLSSKKVGVKMQKSLIYFCGRPLGDTPEEWAEQWKADGLRFESPVQGEINRLQAMACRLLSDIGAEGTEYVVAHLRYATEVPRPYVNEAALKCSAVLCRLAREEIEEHLAELPKIRRLKEKEAEVAWRERKVVSDRRLLEFAKEAGLKLITQKNDVVRSAAYDCLGATANPAVTVVLAKRLLQGGESAGGQIMLARALGEIGDVEAVKALVTLSRFHSYTSDAKALREEYEIILAAVRGLGAIAAKFSSDEATGAFEELLVLLENKRELPGSPRRTDEAKTLIQDVALLQLQQIMNLRATETDPRVWRRHYASQREKLRRLGGL